MKKLVALACAAALAVSAAPVYANPSIADVYSFVEETIAVEETSIDIPEGDAVVVDNAEVEQYKEFEAIQEVIEMLNDTENTYTVVELLEAAGVTFVDENNEEKTFKTTDGNDVDPAELEVITRLLTFEYESNGELLEDGTIKATLPACEALKGEKAENIIIVQYDLEQYEKMLAGEDVEIEPYFIEVLDIDEETGAITAVFPCTGPFFITVKPEA